MNRFLLLSSLCFILAGCHSYTVSEKEKSSVEAILTEMGFEKPYEIVSIKKGTSTTDVLVRFLSLKPGEQEFTITLENKELISAASKK